MTKQEAAKQRINYALDKIGTAHELLEKTMQALGSVVGASYHFRQIREIANKTKDVFYILRDLDAESLAAMRLDREPDEKQEQRYLVTAPSRELLAEQLMTAWSQKVHPNKSPPKWTSDGTDHKNKLPVPDEVKSLWRALADVAIETLVGTP